MNRITMMVWLVTQEPVILECKVKWALRSTAVNKASRCNKIPEELFKFPRDDAIMLCIHYVSKSGRPSSGHRTGKGQSSSQFSKQVVPKNVLTTGQLYSSPMLVRSCLKILHARLQHYVNQESPGVQAGFR